MIAIAMGDPVGAGVAATLEKPGGNVTGSTDYVDPAQLLPSVTGATPRPTRIGTVFDPSNQNMAVWVAGLHAAAAGIGVEVVDATISGPGDVAAAARSLTGQVDSILIGPDATVISAVAAVGSVAGQDRLPMYVVGGDVTVPGVLASIGPNYPEVGAQAAHTAAAVLSGTPISDVAFTTPRNVRMQISGTAMRDLGITFPEAVLATATVS